MRGLMIRSDNRAYVGISRLLAVFEDEEVGRDAARSMVILSRENDGVIAKENSSVIRVRGTSLLCTTCLLLNFLPATALTQAAFLCFHHAKISARLSRCR